MPNYRCTKCNRQIFDIITTDEEKRNTVELFFSRLKKKFAYFYDIKPEVKHCEIQSKHNCDGIIKLYLFNATPENFRSINFISFLKSKNLDGLKKEIILKIIQNNKNTSEINKINEINNHDKNNTNDNDININKIQKINKFFSIFLYYLYICYVLITCVINSLRKYT